MVVMGAFFHSFFSQPSQKKHSEYSEYSEKQRFAVAQRSHFSGGAEKK